MNKCENKVCENGKICNPETARCVNIDGKIGSKLVLLKQKINEQQEIYEYLKLKFNKEVRDYVISKYNIIKKLGEGVYGSVFSVKSQDGNIIALKIQKLSKKDKQLLVFYVQFLLQQN